MKKLLLAGFCSLFSMSFSAYADSLPIMTLPPGNWQTYTVDNSDQNHIHDKYVLILTVTDKENSIVSTFSFDSAKQCLDMQEFLLKAIPDSINRIASCVGFKPTKNGSQTTAYNLVLTFQNGVVNTIPYENLESCVRDKNAQVADEGPLTVIDSQCVPKKP